jgi:hypothetical protein
MASRPARWRSAVAAASAARDQLIDALDALEEIRQEYEEWKDNLPESLQSSALYEKLVTVCDLDFESAKDGFDIIDEAEGMDLPLGFGRD